MRDPAPSTGRTVGLLGHGSLRDALVATLRSGGVRVVTGETVGDLGATRPVALVVATDAWDLGAWHPACRSRTTGVPWLPVHTRAGHAVWGRSRYPAAPVVCGAPRCGSTGRPPAGLQRRRSRGAGTP
jgi:hypothetical protein